MLCFYRVFHCTVAQQSRADCSFASCHSLWGVILFRGSKYFVTPVCQVHIVVIADNVSTMHAHRCAYNSCNTVHCVHMPMSTSESWFTFNHARIFSDLPFDCVSKTENNLSTNACDDGAETKSWAINVRILLTIHRSRRHSLKKINDLVVEFVVLECKKVGK